MLRQLIVNADDFGYTPGVVNGIFRAHKEGIVTSTSVLVNGPAAADGLLRAKDEAPKLGLGLHLNLTAGQPIAPPHTIPDLLQPDGTFHSPANLFAKLPTLELGQVEHEFRAQINRFIELAGHPPDHLDSHHHVTSLNPPLAALTIDLARELGIPIRRLLPTGENGPAEKATQFLTRIMGNPPRTAYVEEMVTLLESFCQDTEVPMPDYFITSFYGDNAILAELLLRLLDVQEGVTEIMCHPAELDETLEQSSGYYQKREEELIILTHPSVKEVLRTEFIQLINFGDIKPRA